MKQKVLFVSGSNSFYSQMAEALLGRIDSQHFEAMSAGTPCGSPPPFTMEVMTEMGIDMGKTLPRSVQELTEHQFDCVIVLGEKNSPELLKFSSAETLHWKFDDPVAGSNDPQAQLREFRMVRDQIAQRLRLFAIVNSRSQKAS